MIHFVAPATQTFGVEHFLADWGSALAGRVRVVHYESLPACTQLERGTWILSALDQLGPATLALTTALHERLQGADGVRVLNDPSRTLRRHDLLAALHADGVNRFRAVRATGDLRGLRYPVFLREERHHDGPVSPLLRSRAEVDAAIGRAVVLGSRARDLLVVEFCDTADAAGYYRKYAAYRVGDRVIPRGLAYGRAWMLKLDSTEFSAAMLEEERRYIVENPHADALRAIFARAAVGYGRMDYGVLDGRVQTWEINLNPTIGRGPGPTAFAVPPELVPLREPGRQHFFAALCEAFAAADAGGEGLPPLPFDAPDALRRAAAAEHVPRGRPAGRFASTMRAALRPARPLLEPVARHLLPLLGRLSALATPSSAR